jgi:MFS family permease
MIETRQQEKIPLAQMAFIQLLVLLPSYCLPAVLPLVEQQWGISHAQAGVMVAAFQAGYVAAALVALPLTDRIDARYVFAGGAVLSVVTHLLFPLLAQGALSGTLLRALTGAGLGGIYMPGVKIISLAPGSRGRAVGTYVSSYLVGTSLSFALTGALTAFLTWQQAYLALSGLSSGAVILALWLWRRPAGVFLPCGRREQTPGSPAENAGTTRPLPENRPVPAAQGPPRAGKNRSNLAIALIILGYTGHMWEMYGLRSWLTPFLTAVFQDRYAQPTSLAATLTAVSVALGAPSTPLAGWLSDRLGRTRTALAIMLTSAACSIAFGWLLAAPLWLLLLVGLVYSFTVTADSPVFSAGLAEIAPREKLGRIMAWQTFTGYLVAIVSPAVFGLILDIYPGRMGWIVAFSSLGAGVLVGAVMMFCLFFLPASRTLDARSRV